jgi:FkbM family methyltransferase
MFNIRNINELKMMARIGIYSLIHSHTYDKKSVLYPFVNFKTLMNILITGHRDIASFEIIKDLYGSDDGESLLFQDVRIPIPKDEQAIIHGFLIEIGDIIIPYICNNDMSIIHGITNEGPYEINRHVRLKPSDIVIDAGANLGLFSAVACAKGCEVYAFEPVPSIIETYLNKTVLWNPPPPPRESGRYGSIKIAPYALSDRAEKLAFDVGDYNLGTSHRSDIDNTTLFRKGNDKITVDAIPLDAFVEQNRIPRVDFIKADIEGSERNLLMGAEQVLREYAPRIAIRTYHLPDDPRVLRSLIKKANPRYTIIEKYKTMYAWV